MVFFPVLVIFIQLLTVYTFSSRPDFSAVGRKKVKMGNFGDNSIMHNLRRCLGGTEKGMKWVSGHLSITF